MKVSILGTNGFLSTAIAKYGNTKGWSLDMYGRNEPSGYKFDHFHKINFLECVMDYSGLLQSDLIVYAAGAGIQSCTRDELTHIYALNVTVPVTICNALRNLGYGGTVVTFGSYFEIGETTETHAFTEVEVLESVAPAPNDYCISKRMLSRFVSSYEHEFKHWHFILPTIYGAGENSMRLIPYTINAIKNGEDVHYTSGDQIRQYVHVNEIPQLIEKAFTMCLPSGVYNIAGIDICTVLDVVRLIHKHFGIDVPLNCIGSEVRDDVGMHYLALDGSLLNKLLGFNACISIADALESYL